MANLFEKYSEEYPETVIMQLRGNFYNAFNDSAYVLSDVMGYMLKETKSGHKAGFPVSALSKVKECLAAERINHVFLDNGIVVESGDYADNCFERHNNIPVISLMPEKVKEMAKGGHAANAGVVHSSGRNLEDAVSSMSHVIEQEYLDRGFSIKAFSFIDREEQDGYMKLCGIVIYEQG